MEEPGGRLLDGYAAHRIFMVRASSDENSDSAPPS